MIKIQVLTVGTLPKGAFPQLSEDFLKQLQKYASVDIREYKTLESMLEKDLPSDAFLLDEGGRTRTSVEFAELVRDFEDRGAIMTFILGGPDGFSDEIKKRFARFSLSPMTTTHDIARIFLFEQLFRACAINHGSGYHRA